jgi:hypothetical protein
LNSGAEEILAGPRNRKRKTLFGRVEAQKATEKKKRNYFPRTSIPETKVDGLSIDHNVGTVVIETARSRKEKRKR